VNFGYGTLFKGTKHSKPSQHYAKNVWSFLKAVCDSSFILLDATSSTNSIHTCEPAHAECLNSKMRRVARTQRFGTKRKKLKSCFVERVSNIFGLEPPLRGPKAPMKLVAFESKIYHWKLKAICWVLQIRLSGQICCRLWAAHYCRLQKVLNLLKYPPSILETGIQCKYLLKNWTELIPPKISFKIKVILFVNI